MSRMPSWRARTIISTMVGLVAFAGVARAQSQTVQVQVNAINVIAVTPAAGLVISTAVAGSLPSVQSTASWAVTTNQTGAKVTARINTAMPPGLTLSAEMAEPAGGAVSAGMKVLSTTATDMVTGITMVAQAGMLVTYQLDATLAANPTSGSKTVTFTITGGV
jgi:hypothetical protein